MSNQTSTNNNVITAVGFAKDPNNEDTIVVLSNGNTWDVHYGVGSHTIDENGIKRWSDDAGESIYCPITEIDPVVVLNALDCARVAAAIERTL